MAESKPGRNEPCHCGSGQKYKRCCLAKDEAAARDAREKAAGDAPDAPAAAEAPTQGATAATPPRRATDQPWKRKQAVQGHARRFSAPRKVGGS